MLVDNCKLKLVCNVIKTYALLIQFCSFYISDFNSYRYILDSIPLMRIVMCFIKPILLIFTVFHIVASLNSQEAPENGFLKREFSLMKPYSGV